MGSLPTRPYCNPTLLLSVGSLPNQPFHDFMAFKVLSNPSALSSHTSMIYMAPSNPTTLRPHGSITFMVPPNPSSLQDCTRSAAHGRCSHCSQAQRSRGSHSLCTALLTVRGGGNSEGIFFPSPFYISLNSVCLRVNCEQSEPLLCSAVRGVYPHSPLE